MPNKLLIDGNNLGHVLGYIDKAAGRYDSRRMLACLDGVARYLAAQGQETEIVLFLDDVSASERLGGWHVQVAPVPDGDADAAIRVYAQAHANYAQTLVSGDQELCGDAAMWSVVCLSPQAFISRYLQPARHAGFFDSPDNLGVEWDSPLGSVVVSEGMAPTVRDATSTRLEDQGEQDRRHQVAALDRTEAALRGEPSPPPEVYRLDLAQWTDATELSLYLAEHHLCPDHAELTDPAEMISTIRTHCRHRPRYFTSGRVIDRVFRIFLCRSEYTLSLDDLTRIAKTRRRKIRAAIRKHGEQLGVVVQW